MFILKLKPRLERFDPYALQRLTAYKAFFMAPILAYAYWIFQPVSFLAYMAPLLLAARYDATIGSYFEKERMILFVFISYWLVSMILYLSFSFKMIFFFSALLVFALHYFYTLSIFPKQNNLTLTIFSVAIMALAISPSSQMQTAINYSMDTALSIFLVLLGLRLFPNYSINVWWRALYQLLEGVETTLNASLLNQKYFIEQEVKHIDMLNYSCRLLPRRYLRDSYRLGYHLRNLQFAIYNMYDDQSNSLDFWKAVDSHLTLFITHVKEWTPCQVFNPKNEVINALQAYATRALNKAIRNWNSLCLSSSK